ncbi:DUF6868 family protein [Fluviispira vulneris]|uniref:DUF6868 family protein n=1 Tax=Fluviispira vulneris TaxID=2763012 RepID=UPI0036F31DC5
MSLDILKIFFMWSTILSVALLIFYSFILLVFKKHLIQKMQIFIKLPEDKISVVIFSALVFLKILSIILFIIPYFTVLIITM